MRTIAAMFLLMACTGGAPEPPYDAALVRQHLLDAGLEAAPAPPEVSDELFLLGQMLAFDPILSGNEDIACLTCHHPVLGTDDDRPLSAGTGAEGLGADREHEPVIPRSAPPLFNLHVYETLFWDSRVEHADDGAMVTPAGPALAGPLAAPLEHGLVSAQAMFPVTSRHEMRGEKGDNELADLADDDFAGMWAGLMARLGAIPEYVDLFEAAYPGTRFGELTFGHAANALAAFEIRAFAATATPLDAFLRGDDDALSAAQRDGAVAFVDAGCAGCHTGPALSDFSTHNTCLPHIGPGKGHGEEEDQDYGRGGIDPEGGPFAFRTAPLRNVTLTGPYGHAGQFADLEAYLGHYADPRGAMEDYDVEREVADPAFWELYDDTENEAILATVDPAIPALEVDVDAILPFLDALEDPASRDLRWTVPASVPSGLPMDPLE